MQSVLRMNTLYRPISLGLFCAGLFFFPFRNILLLNTPLSNMLFFLSILSLVFFHYQEFTDYLVENKTLRWGSLFLAYAVTLNLVWSFHFKTTLAVKYLLFMLFNLLLYVNFIFLKRFYSQKFLGYLKKTSLASLISLVACAFFNYRNIMKHIMLQKEFPQSVIRDSLYFENASSLGYFAILALGIILLASPSTKEKILAFTSASILVALSISRASMLALAILYLGLIVRQTSILSVIVLSSVGLYFSIGKHLLVWLYKWFPVKFSILLRMGQRYSQDYFENRGFEVLGKGAEKHLLWGVSELFIFNNPSLRFQTEPHASLGYLLIDYGVIGLGLLLFFHFKVTRSAKNSYLAVFLGVSVYGLFHNGLRNPLYWIILACIYSYGQKNQANSKSGTGI